jgi:hypothetical protein
LNLGRSAIPIASKSGAARRFSSAARTSEMRTSPQCSTVFLRLSSTALKVFFILLARQDIQDRRADCALHRYCFSGRRSPLLSRSGIWSHSSNKDGRIFSLHNLKHLPIQKIAMTRQSAF